MNGGKWIGRLYVGWYLPMRLEWMRPFEYWYRTCLGPVYCLWARVDEHIYGDDL